MKRRLRDGRTELPLVALIGELKERQRATIGKAKKAVTISAELAEQLVGFAPGCNKRKPNHFFVELAGLLHILRRIGCMMKTARKLGSSWHSCAPPIKPKSFAISSTGLNLSRLLHVQML